MIAQPLIVLATVLLFYCKTVTSFATGAAGCLKPPSVGGAHNDNSNGKVVRPLEWTNTTKNLVLKAGGKTIALGGTITVPLNTKVDIILTGNGIKGVLFREEGPFGYNVTGTLLPKTSTKVAGSCNYPIYGITHTSGDAKPLVSATALFTTVPDTPIDLDMTVVYYNSDTLSEFTYGSFKLTACKPKKCGFIASLFGCKSKC